MRVLRLLLALVIATAAFAGDPNQKRGFSPNEVFQTGDIDHVNLFNGNVAITIPLGQAYQAGPLLQYQFMLTYNSKVWDYKFSRNVYPGCSQDQMPCDLRYAIPESTSTAGFGWTVSLGRLVLPTSDEPAHGWLYIGPDGAEHGFNQSIDPPSSSTPPMNMVRARTTDSDYLELRRDNPNAPEVWFPDGHVRKFDSSGRLTEIRDRYGNWVRVQYLAQQWVVTDGFGSDTARTHYVNFLSKAPLYPNVPNFQSLVSSVDLAAFDNTPDNPNDGNDRAVYSFSYEDHWTGIGGDGARDGLVPGLCMEAPFLTNVAFPDATTYQASYKNFAGPIGAPNKPAICVEDPNQRFTVLDPDYGAIQSLKLPIGGSIEWAHGLYLMNMSSCMNGTGYAKGYVGVRSRTFKDRNGAELMKWTYTPTLVPRPGLISQTCEGQYGLIPSPAEEFYNDVEIWSGPTASGGRKLRTRNYFSAFPQEGLAINGVTGNGFRPEEYGRPFTHNNSLGSGAAGDLRLLASEVSDCTTTCDPLQRGYVLYEQDPIPMARNHRLVAERTVDLKASDCSGACYTDTQRSDFDGYGHYRRSVTTSSYPGTPMKTTFTNHTPDATNWLLNLYTTSWVKDGTGATAVASKSIAAFDTTKGVMTSLRTLRAIGPDPDALNPSTGDLLSAWCREPQRGFVTSERHFGGDGISIPGSPCTASRSTGNYFINHTYTFANAAVKTHKAQYDGTSHWIADEELDPNTGKLYIVRDSAGVQSKFGFDTSGRPTFVRPHGRAATTYAYSPLNVPAQVTVGQECPSGTGASPCSSDMLTESRSYYDDLGRLSQESRLFAASSWSSTWTTYDGMGRKKTVSMPTETSGAAQAQPSNTPLTTWTYDVLGRPLAETRPDQGTTTWIYSGSRKTERYVAGEKRSTEIYNGRGELIEVKQRADAALSDIATTYGYDFGGRLASVLMAAPGGAAQGRTFDYDGRGFLRWESQPESGMAAYTYDSRGHILTKGQSAANTQFDLKYEYDAAERLVTLSARNPAYGEPGEPLYRAMKTFAYGLENASGDLRKGKLVTAARYNYPTPDYSADENTYIIEDIYKYGDASGRTTLRTTKISRIYPDYGPLELKSIDTGVTYNALDLPVSFQYPTCVNCGTPPSASPDRSGMTYAYQRGRLKSINGFVSNATYWPNGLRNVLEHSNGRTDQQLVTNMPRPSKISFVPTPATLCQRPTFTTQPASTTVPSGGGSAILSVVPGGTGPFEYEWFRVSDQASVGITQSITVTVTANESYYVMVVNACGFEQSQTAKVTVGSCETATIHGIETIRQPDGKWLLKPDLTARAGRQIVWTRVQPNPGQVDTTETVIVPAPVSPTTYRLTITDCGTTTRDVTLTPPPSFAQTTVTATRTGATQITVTWSAASNASSYSVERRSGAEWETIASGLSAGPHVDNTVAANKSYAYRVYAGGAGLQSDHSKSDIATTRTFIEAVTNQLIIPAPFDDMLAAVNSARAAAGWSPVTWANILASSDPLPQPAAQIIERHVTSARSRMNEALSALGVPLQGYTDTILLGVPIRALHVNEVQQRVQ